MYTDPRIYLPALRQCMYTLFPAVLSNAHLVRSCTQVQAHKSTHQNDRTKTNRPVDHGSQICIFCVSS